MRSEYWTRHVWGRWLLLCGLAALALTLLGAVGAHAKADRHQDSPDRRAAALVDQMTLDEKISLVHGIAVCQFTPGNFPGSERTLKGAGFIPGIPRLGIPDINYTDAGAGVTNCGARPNGRSTMLPSPLARASSWNPAATYEAGALIGKEARVQGFTGLLGGVSELIREPRWGRSFETLGEDPVLNGTLVASELRGVQSQKVVATIKHYAANNQETGRQQHSVEIDERTLRELHVLAYEIAVPASQVGSVMCSYNKVNGDYACENDYLINTVLKGDLGFKGQVQSDWGATHSTVRSALAGLDEEEFLSQYFGQALKTAVESGQVPESRLDDMVQRKLRTLIAVGIYDDPPPPPGSIDVSYGAKVTERIARQSSVLLKNERRTLPLSRRDRSIAVIGSHADVGVLSGGGSSQVTPPGGPAVTPTCNPEGPGGSHCPVWAPSSPLQAIQADAPQADVRFADGTDPAAAAALARSSDVAVVFAHEWRAEGADAQEMNLPDLGPPEWPVVVDQEALIRTVAAANRNTVVVLQNGGPLVMPWIGDVRAVLEAWYPGSSGGPAIADVLFGKVNPSGKLTVTFPRQAADTPTGAAPPTTALSIPYTERLLVGYRWYDAKGIQPLFEFGHGLSYTHYRYSQAQVAGSRHGLRVSFRVTNTGSRSGSEVAQVYAGLPAKAGEPPKRLVGWARVDLRPGETRRATVEIEPKRLAVWDAGAHRWNVVDGRYDVFVGASSRDIRLKGAALVR
jgi:beta-glucosidase